MAKPQKEDGYTPIANELLEQFYGLKLNGTQYKIIMVVWRYTYGFSRKGHELSETFISKAINTDKRQVRRELNDLIELKIIKIIKDATFSSSRIIGINKDYSSWSINNPQRAEITPEGELDHSPEGEKAHTPEGELDPQDKQTLKQYKENIIVDTADALPTTPKFSDDSFELLVVETIIHSCLELYPNSKVPSTYKEKEKWAKEIEKMRRIDNRTEEEIRQALQFATSNSFWQPNIRSTKKFREKFEMLLIQSRQKNNGTNKGQQKQDEFFDNLKEWYSETR